MLIAACEGYFDKENDHSRIVRLQTYYLLNVQGAKIHRPEDLWVIEGEANKEIDTFTWGTKEEAAALRAEIEKVHGKMKFN